VLGTVKALIFGLDPIPAALMGVLTAIGGGVLRDLLANRTPIVLREDVYREHPWAARSLYNAFSQAKDLAVNGLYDTDALHLALPWLLDHVEEAWRVFGKDFWSYGLEPNRETFTAIGQYVHDQGLSPRVVSADELFPPEFR